MEKLNKCPICNNSNFTIFLKCVDFTTTKEVFEITKCNDCGFKFTNPRPNSDEILKYYDSPEYISHTNSNQGIINWTYQQVKKFSIENKYKLIRSFVKRKDFTILDIGCGTADFLKYCQTQGAKCSGVEPNPKAREYCINTNNINTFKEEDIDTFKNESFDVITMWHVLEHVHTLNRRIEELNKLIKKDGIVIIALPNPESFDAIHYKQFWAGFDVPRHLYHFSSKNIIQLMEAANFNHIQTRPMVFDSFYVSLLSEKYINGKGNIIKAFCIGFFSYINSLFRANKSSSQIYIFRKA
ncbi:MAG: hypothetical protein A2X12_01940 [Bacteroidetes bacterium GWE2_29_8]|nr:MAG: hypothetical protein A2X12_01940 [Bacteroidetes bacterium GWE2_29_8]